MKTHLIPSFAIVLALILPVGCNGTSGPRAEKKAPPKKEAKVAPKAEKEAPPKKEAKIAPKAEKKAPPKKEAKIGPKAEKKAPPKKDSASSRPIPGVNVPRGYEMVDSMFLTTPGKNGREKLERALGKKAVKSVWIVGVAPARGEPYAVIGGFRWSPQLKIPGGTIRVFLPRVSMGKIRVTLDGKQVWSHSADNARDVLSPEIAIPKDKRTSSGLRIEIDSNNAVIRGGVSDILILRAKGDKNLPSIQKKDGIVVAALNQSPNLDLEHIELRKHAVLQWALFSTYGRSLGRTVSPKEGSVFLFVEVMTNFPKGPTWNFRGFRLTGKPAGPTASRQNLRPVVAFNVQGTFVVQRFYPVETGAACVIEKNGQVGMVDNPLGKPWQLNFDYFDEPVQWPGGQATVQLLFEIPTDLKEVHVMRLKLIKIKREKPG